MAPVFCDTGITTRIHMLLRIGCRLNSLGQTEVCDEWSSVVIDQDIRRFEISMQNPFGVRSLNCIGHRQQQSDGLLRIHWTIHEAVVECFTFDVLHTKPWMASMIADIVHRHHIRMAQLPSGQSFQPQSRQIIRRRKFRIRNHLECDVASQSRLPGSKDNSHSSSTNFFEQFIFPDLRTDASLPQRR